MYAKLLALKARYNAMLDNPNAKAATVRRLREQIIKLEHTLGF